MLLILLILLDGTFMGEMLSLCFLKSDILSEYIGISIEKT